MKLPFLHKKRGRQDELGPRVRIAIEETVAFVGNVESFNIATDIEGSDATCIITFRATDLIKQLKITAEQ